MKNLELWERVRECPSGALKSFNNGRFSGTDINPLWRLKTLTSEFGLCGFGWYYTIDKEWLETGLDGAIKAFVTISLYVKQDNEWSKPIQGTGGNTFSKQEKKGIYTNDECFKMSLTDAIGVACKNLGFGANVYWNKDKTKYTENVDEKTTPVRLLTPKQKSQIIDFEASGKDLQGSLNYYGFDTVDDMTEKRATELINHWTKKGE